MEAANAANDANDKPELTREQEATHYYTLGCQLKEAGNLLKAYEHFKHAVYLNPLVPPYHLNLALTCADIVRMSEHLGMEGWVHAQHAVKMMPKMIGYWIGLGEVSLLCNKFPEAVAAFEHVISVDPKDAKWHKLLGFSYSKMFNEEKALEHYQIAVDLDPEMGDVHFLLSTIYSGDRLDRWKQAYHGERGFLVSKPAILAVESKWNSAHGFLGIGDFRKGWEYFESRLLPNATNVGNVLVSQRLKIPMWKGETTHIVREDGFGTAPIVRIHTEMGFGDVFLMARYLRQVINTGVKVVLECSQNMFRLMETNFPEAQLLLYDTEMDMECDYHLPIMSLPWVLKNFDPRSKPYLMADLSLIAGWNDLLKIDHNKLNVGICWASGKNSFNAGNHETSRRKSLLFEQIKPILDVEGVNFVSLQVERDAGLPNPGIADFADTAAIIANMDLIITVDSAVANLAGAMGKEVWLMDRFDYDWRWAKHDKPWFNNVKIFRQSKPHDWENVVSEIAAALPAIRAKM